MGLSPHSHFINNYLVSDVRLLCVDFIVNLEFNWIGDTLFITLYIVNDSNEVAQNTFRAYLRGRRVFELSLSAMVEPLAVLLLFLLLGRSVLAHALGLSDVGRVHLSEGVHLGKIAFEMFFFVEIFHVSPTLKVD